MAEAKPPSTTDLLLLIAGLQLVKSPETNADFGEHYYLNEPTTTEERTLRESLPNPLWLRSPKAAWNSVKFRDWLIGTLAASVTDNKHDFTTISEPLIMSLDLLSKEFKRGMAGMTNEIDELLTTANTHRDREFFSTLSVGMSKRRIDGKEVFTLGAGMRRRARVWLNSLEALQAEVEFFLPFYVIPSSSHPPDANFANARSICAGIKISKSNGAAIGRDENNKELVAMRFNLRIPFTTHWTSEKKSAPEDFVTKFGTPELQFQKRVKDGATTGEWEKFGRWKDFLENYVKLSEVSDLLNSPIGPLLIAKVSDPSGVTDIILKQKKRDEIKSDLKDAKRDLDDQLKLLKSIWTWEPPKRDAVGPHSTQRKLGSLLAALGFMSGKQGSGGEFEYTFKVGSGVTAWSVLDQLFGELDGFPLWVKGLTPKTDREPRIALSLASQENLIDTRKKYFGLAGLAYNIPLTPVPAKSEEKDLKKEEDVKTPTIKLSKDNFTDDESILVPDEPEDGQTSGEKKPSDTPKSTVEVLLHLGKWMSSETLDDNWFQRLLPPPESPQQHRIPLPGIRLLPFKRVPAENRPEAIFDWTLLIDLLSLGIDIKSTSKDGLVFLKGLAGHFGLGAVEIRLALKFSLEDIRNEKSFFERVAIGIGFKLKDLRLSFGPPEEEKKKEKSGNEIIDGLQELLADDWVAVPTPEKGPEPKLKTRLNAKKKDKFSISIGYLTPLKEGSHGTLDIQLYDEKGNRGKMALIPIDRFADPIYLRQIGIGLKGVENVELSKGLSEKAMLTVSLTGGFRLPVFEMGFIGAKLSFPLNNPLDFKFGLDGLDVSLKIGDVVISGSFFKSGIEYAGSLTVDVPKASFSAMGFYGPMRVFDLSRDQEIINQLNLGKVHKKLQTKLTESKITPAAVNRVPAPGEWELVAADNTRYTITDDDDKVNLLRHEKTFFVFAMLNAAAGGGITAGPIQFTGIALGYGYNRRLKVPLIENVAEFPLVKMVMGEGGHQKDETDLIKQLGKPLENPASTLADMSEHLVAERGQQFACAGVRFTINGVIDCFALLVVQVGGGEIEISLLGLARFRHTRDASAKPICYVEMQILMSIKPSEGTFKLQALLTSNSWIFNTDCKLTGGFALCVWFGGPHKGDAVLTLGGYHPRFQRPEHYPIVPRLGLNWTVNNNLSIKGGVYFALTPSCLMVGGKLEATFNSGRISAWFTVHLDVIINWFPVFFEVDIGISLRVEAAFFLTSLKVTIGASIKMCGPPVRGVAHIDLLVVSFDIFFGPENPKEPELIGTWQQFCHKFLNLSGGDRRAVNEPVRAFPIVQPTLAAGRNNLNALPNDRRKDPQPKSQDAVWKVRADEVELAATAVVPVTNLKLGRAADGIQSLNVTGNPMMVTKPLVLESSGIQTKNSAGAFGAHPMGKKLDSVLNVTVISDDASAPAPDVSQWTLDAEIGALPEAVWKPEKPNLKPSEPTAKLIAGCITGIKRLKPPKGTLGKHATPPTIEWHPLEPGKVRKSETAQESPSATRSRNIQPTLVQKQDEQKQIAEAFKTAGFSLTWQPAEQVHFRELQADPLAGAVAA